MCPNGHVSEWEDYCSVCGVSLGEASSAAAPAETAAEGETAVPPEEPAASVPSGPTCPNCSEPYAEGDVFCENCGFDFLSGTLPNEEEPAAAISGETEEAEGAEEVTVDVATIEVDLDFFERMGFAGVDAPTELPEPKKIELPPTDILVGRHSESRGTFPEIDLSSVFGDDSPATDPAVSSNHCRLHRGSGGWTVTDLDSTNGTYLEGEDKQLKPNVPTELPEGTAVYVGAWTKITIE